ncbi:MAG: fumarylacetoacetate hydrolase family protein [Euryarchaeota archaeon]|nr:fumarylacetoacetate hydrolase family protein [Euryarchaeota archaeon]
MKLATIRLDAPDSVTRRLRGRLVVVDDDQGTVAEVPEDITPDLWTALHEWDRVEPELRKTDARLKAGDHKKTRAFDDCRFLAPLPRTTSWLDGSAFIQHIILVRKARGAEPPEDLRTVPLMYQGVGDPLLGPTDDIPVTSEDYGIDFEAEVAVVLDDVPMGTKPADAEKHIKLVLLMNDVSLRKLIPRELKAGFGFFHGKPPSSFAPYAVTPDALGSAWKDGRVQLEMNSELNGEPFGHPHAGEMYFSFPQLIEHAAKTRPLPAGTILGSGTVSNEDESVGSSCLAEKRMLETIKDGKPTTEFMRFGDRIRIWMEKDGKSVFGDIDQKVVQAGATATVTTAGRA